MSTAEAIYLLVRLALSVFAGVMAGITLQYAAETRRDGRHWRVAVAGGVLLLAAAGLSIFEAIQQAILRPFEPIPIENWLWLFGFDLLLPIWALFLVRAWRERDRAEIALARLSVTDPLTGVLNRRGYIAHGVAAIEVARRRGERLAVITFDIDRFKPINDGYGHDAGDAVLRALAASVAAVLRSDSVFGRAGGEEFALLLPGVELDQASAVAERIRGLIRGAVPHPAGEGAVVTVSAGVAALPEVGDPESALTAALSAADAALYEAKRAGRDRVFINRGLSPSLVPQQHSGGTVVHR
jgi:diguanylate cyclase (GGDEF)-like protein